MSLRSRPSPRRYRSGLSGWALVALLAAVAVSAFGCQDASAVSPDKPGKSPAKPIAADWNAVEALVDEQKLEAAAAKVAEIVTAAQAAGDDLALAKALVRRTQLRIALGGFETAVEELKATPWPEAKLPRSAVELYYAHALLDYQEAYSWEVRQRERVASDETLDMKLWTTAQIVAEAEESFLAVLARREALGEVAVDDFPYIQANDYPKGIRDTLRDAVTYLFVDRLLADSSFWTPAQANDRWQLDLSGLLADQPEIPESGAVHPLARAAATLADLERWHRAEGRPGAELEARLARVRLLAAHFTEAANQSRLVAELEKVLPGFRRDAWWSEGMATLAERVQEGAAADRLIRARAIAVEAEKAYPGSYGADRARRLREGIEAPDFSLQTMALDGPDRRSIEIQHRNLEALHFRAYRVDLDSRLATSEFRGFFPQQEREVERLIAGTPAASWSVDLPPTRDFASHRTFSEPPLERSGLYLVVASADRTFRAGRNRRVALPFTLSDLVLLDERATSPWEVRLVAGRSGVPAAGVPVTLYSNNWRNAPRVVERVTTDADGRARFAESTSAEPQNLLLVARRGDDVALSQRYGRPPRAERSPGTGGLLFTDRAVYRPEQKLYWKLLGYRSGTARGDLKPAPETPVEVWLNDPNGEKVAFLQVKTNAFGTAAGEFTIPSGRLLGQWWLYSSLGGHQAVRIEEYKRPTFEVEIEEPETALRLNRAAKLAGEARYYFGLPVTSGRVAWKVERSPILPWWARSWGWGQFWGGGPGSTEPQTIASGVATLDADGRFALEFTPAADESEKATGLTYSYAVEADVTDDGGETRSGSRRVRLGWSAVETELDPGLDLFLDGKPSKIVATRRDLDGVGRAGKGSWRLLALEQPERAPLPADLPLRAPSDPAVDPKPGGAEFATPGDALRPRWGNAMEPEAMLRFFADGRELSRGEITHAASGKGEIALGPLPAGAYRLRYETVDDFGGRFTAFHDFVVAGADTKLALPVEIAFERAVAQPGDALRLWVHSGLAKAPVQLEIHRGDELLLRRRLELTGSTFIDLEVTEVDRGGLAARAVLVADHQMIAAGATLDVPWKNKELAVEIATFRDKLTPGAKERFRVTVKKADPADTRPVEAGAAEILASMHDRSLDLFAPFAAPRPLALFPTSTPFPPLSSNLGASGPIWYRDDDWLHFTEVEALTTDAFVEISPYGIGGPGGRYPARRMMKTGVVNETMMADAAAPASAPAPQMAQELGEAVRVEGGVAGGVAAGKAAGAEAPQPSLRADFAETAFWRPQLLTGADGSATIEFTMPDSVTSWRLWAAALTRSLASGYAELEIDSVKELMVRPYLPRFLREGDRAELKVVVNDAGETPLAGEARLEIYDPETNASLLAEFGLAEAAARKSFRVEPGKGVDLTFPIVAPKRVGATAFKVTATAGALSDGELRPLPLLPSRIHLAQSRFVALSNADRREMTFEDMKAPDPTRINDRLVVTVDGQLFYSMLDALPYLVDFPYECTEQTMNRFVSTGMLSSLFASYPAVGKMAAELAKRETPFERFDQADPNRRMALEETPWLRQSRGSAPGADKVDFLRVLDPKVAAAQRDEALAKLAKAQLPNGGFPWFAGGPASPYITLYLTAGFARATEFGVDVPKEMVQRSWNYLAREAKQDWLPKAIQDDCCWELLTFLNYVASSYPDPSWVGGFLDDADRRKILDFSFKHWKEHQPLLKLQLALTLKRMQRAKDAELVLASVMDSAKTTRDEGTFWQPEDRAWLWYNDRIETHAWALRALMEIAPADKRRDGLVQWLFLNKKLNHWKSTRATAEVLYSLAWYLKATNQLAVREEAKVTVANQSTTFVFEPDRFTGKKNQIVVAGEKLDAEKRPADATVVVEKSTPGLLFASATWHFSTEELPAEARGDLFAVTRRYFKRVKTGEEVTLTPLAAGTKLAVGDEVEVQLSIRAKAQAEYVHLRDPRPAGLEPDRSESGWRWDLGLARYEETRDSGANFFVEWMPAGEYTLKYRLRANLAGEFRSAPAQLQSIYAPEFVAYSAGEKLAIAP